MSHPDFSTTSFLHEHIQDTLAFYAPNVDDPNGGFFQNFSDNGEVFDANTRHLVSSTRFVFNYARAWLAYENQEDLLRVKRGIDFIRQHHLNPETGGYFWTLNVDDGNVTVTDTTNHCYGLAFVVLAYSWALRAGVKEAKTYLYDTWDTLESHFWDKAFGLYKDEANADFSSISSYRGQNANMHACEAMIAAYEATQDSMFLERALRLADNVTNTQAAKCNGWIWEHYDVNWDPDWEFNKDDPKNLFRPWGFQPGHHTEWAKLLLMLSQYSDSPWLVTRAKSLFDSVINLSWDEVNGGLYYGFAPDGAICDGEKYFWVQAETFACAARLALATGDDSYWQWYNKIWSYSWEHFVDHEFGAWYRILSEDNQKLETTKSPVGKTDYHTMGACFDVIDALAANNAGQ